MKNKFTLIFALLCSIQMMAANLVVLTTDGAQQLHDIALIGKWVFTDKELQLLDKSGNLLASEQIAHIRTITFAASATAIENIESDTIMVYPNPTQDVLFVKGIDEQTLRIYDLQGRLLQEKRGKQITVSNLSTGTYLLQIGIQVVRFIKQ